MFSAGKCDKESCGAIDPAATAVPGGDARSPVGRAGGQNLANRESIAPLRSCADRNELNMQSEINDDLLDRMVQEDGRYDREAYLFVGDALNHTQNLAARKSDVKPSHVSGAELLDGIRSYALDTYGPMTLTVFSEWGLARCEDFGEIVFSMIKHELLSKTDEDKQEDFRSIYKFEDAFRHPFLPARKLPKKKVVSPAPAEKQ
ncbi:MAG: putative repeat protein (TIGR04138 family) [Candidatus Binatia bacterium]